MKTYPRYFIGRLWSERDAYLRFDSQHRCVWVTNDGTETPQSPGLGWDADKPDHTWNEVTREMAQARLLPEARPLRWVENCKPDKPGLWARPGATGATGTIGVVSVVTKEGLRNEWNRATRCYLGPIPEILPPLKKVVERLWISHAKQTAQDAAEYLEQWVPEDKREGLAGDWIRTDRTREVER